MSRLTSWEAEYTYRDRTGLKSTVKGCELLKTLTRARTWKVTSSQICCNYNSCHRATINVLFITFFNNSKPSSSCNLNYISMCKYYRNVFNFKNVSIEHNQLLYTSYILCPHNSRSSSPLSSSLNLSHDWLKCNTTLCTSVFLGLYTIRHWLEFHVKLNYSEYI